MELIDYIVIGIIVLIIGSALAYIIKAKRSGKKCIGCPDNCSCHKKQESRSAQSCSGSCSVCSHGCSDASENEKK